MIDAGFNPLQVIAEQSGKSMETLNREMMNGAVSSDMVAGAFSSATAEGGKFQEMMESQPVIRSIILASVVLYLCKIVDSAF